MPGFVPSMVGLDFETYSAVPLAKHGLHRYVNDKSFTPLIAGFAETLPSGYHKTAHIDLTACSLKAARSSLSDWIGDNDIVAHNAPFEEAVLRWMGLEYPASRFIDSAVVARAAGAGPRLEAAAPQLLPLGTVKMESGRDLIRLFSVPGLMQERNKEFTFDREIVRLWPKQWAEFGRYCEVDASLGLQIVEQYLHRLTPREMGYQALTMEMDRLGWPVDIDKVQEMNLRYLENKADAEFQFTTAYLDSDINLNSLKQMKEWCLKRGVRASSFDEKHVTKLIEKISHKVATMSSQDPKYLGYMEVLHLLNTKQVLGGSALKKLAVILDTVVEDADGVPRLRDQYVHCGAGQTLRTTGRGVQMQNLKRLSLPRDMVELEDPGSKWDNTALAANMRQVFTASEQLGALLVGDFASVESRGLGYMANEAWKMNAYRKGQDIYQVLADRFGQSRTFGKVGELSCGYGAGPDAVMAFAEGMGITLSEGESSKLVHDWRAANPRTVEFWTQLNDMIQKVVLTGKEQQLICGQGHRLFMSQVETPPSLRLQHAGVQSIQMRLVDSNGFVILLRYFHGCYSRGGNVAYYRPSQNKTGDLWRPGYVDPKTKEYRLFELYGGKLAGILTQSLCREIFMHVLDDVAEWARHYDYIDVVGQFHDEIVMDWRPGVLSVNQSIIRMMQLMSTAPSWVPRFPLTAEVKSAYRYIK